MTHQVVVIGGGFAGLYAARALRRAAVRITLLDRQNYHLFQPLLYQVATGSLSPANIATPLRKILRRQKNVEVLMAEALSVDPHQQLVNLREGTIAYDTLIVATGASHDYFGNAHFEQHAPGLKSIWDATRIRSRILSAFEAAENSDSEEQRRRLLTFMVVGAGPTGLELAGAIAELAHQTLRPEYRRIDTAKAQVLLVEGQSQLLPSYPPRLAKKALDQIARLGVTPRTGMLVRDVAAHSVVLSPSDSGEDRSRDEVIPTSNVFWAAGVKASPLGRALAEATGVPLDRSGRVHVTGDCSIEGFPNIFVLGDLAHFDHDRSTPLPGTGAVATQQGKHMGRQIKRRLRGLPTTPFRYRHLGQMATIGRAAAVCDLGFLQFTGLLAWQAWLFLHLMLLIGFQNRVLVLFQWAVAYFSRVRSARLITIHRDQGPRS